MNNIEKRLFVLGASILQLPAIMKAHEMGLYVGVADYNPNAIGRQYADAFFEVSTIYPKGVCDAAAQFHADGIMTMATDMPMRSVAYTCEKLGLPGIDCATALRATDKGEMIKAFQQNGVEHPAFYILNDARDLNEALSAVGLPCICKPVDNSGSRGVVVCHSIDDLSKAYQYSKRCGRGGDVIVEEYMQGKEVSVEIVCYDGTPHVLAVTDKLTTGEPHFVELGHSQPSQIESDELLKIMDLARRATASIGVRNGAAHVEIMSTESGPKVVEMGARMGGDCITSHLVPLSTGIDMTEAVINIALGIKPNLDVRVENGAAIRYFQAGVGVIRGIRGLEKAKSIHGVLEIVFSKNVGDFVGEIESSTDRIGYVIAQGDHVYNAIQSCEKALNTVEICVS